MTEAIVKLVVDVANATEVVERMEQLLADSANLRRALLYFHWSRTGCPPAAFRGDEWVCGHCRIDFESLSGAEIAKALGEFVERKVTG